MLLNGAVLNILVEGIRSGPDLQFEGLQAFIARGLLYSVTLAIAYDNSYCLLAVEKFSSKKIIYISCFSTVTLLSLKKVHVVVKG